MGRIEHDESFKICCPRAHAAAELTEKDKYFAVHYEHDEDLVGDVSRLGTTLRMSSATDTADCGPSAQTTTKIALKTR